MVRAAYIKGRKGAAHPALAPAPTAKPDASALNSSEETRFREIVEVKWRPAIFQTPLNAESS